MNTRYRTAPDSVPTLNVTINATGSQVPSEQVACLTAVLERALLDYIERNPIAHTHDQSEVAINIVHGGDEFREAVDSYRSLFTDARVSDTRPMRVSLNVH